MVVNGWERVVNYLVTGGTGFIGRFLLEHLLKRDGTVHVLVRESSVGKLDALRARFGAADDRLVPVVGDLTAPRLGISEADLERLQTAGIDHVFHLAAVYDLEADPARQRVVNVEGTRNAVDAAEAVGAGRFHLVSSIAAAGRYPGRFREDMFEEAVGLDHAYFRTKHLSEGVVRDGCEIPWRIYRPGIVVGDSRTGEMDKIDGPYHFFPALERLAQLPSGLPLLGIEGGRAHLVPVDFVAAALDHIAHAEGWDRRTFHLVDPDPPSIGRVINAFASAADGPRFPVRMDVRATEVVPKPLREIVSAFPPFHRATNAVMHGLGIPRQPLSYVTNPTRFDTANADAALADTDIRVPPIEEYADKLWEVWDAELRQEVPGFPLRRRDRIAGRTVLITGASSGIGEAAAEAFAARGAKVLLVARSRDGLEAVRDRIVAAGGEAHVHPADLSDLDDVERLITEVIDTHGGVDTLVNNAGISIRRSVALSYDRFHDFQRTMQINYFGSLRLILGLIPGMRERGLGHVINVSSIGVQTGPPRFAAYIASKSALDAFSQSIATEITDDGVHITTVYMPLVRTKMIAPTDIYKRFPALSPEDAGAMLVRAADRRPKKVATSMGNVGELAYAASPKAVDALMNIGYHLFPDSSAAKGEKGDEDDRSALWPGRRAFSYLFRGIHW